MFPLELRLSLCVCVCVCMCVFVDYICLLLHVVEYVIGSERVSVCECECE